MDVPVQIFVDSFDDFGRGRFSQLAESWSLRLYIANGDGTGICTAKSLKNLYWYIACGFLVLESLFGFFFSIKSAWISFFLCLLIFVFKQYTPHINLQGEVEILVCGRSITLLPIASTRRGLLTKLLIPSSVGCLRIKLISVWVPACSGVLMSVFHRIEPTNWGGILFVSLGTRTMLLVAWERWHKPLQNRRLRMKKKKIVASKRADYTMPCNWFLSE